jgi:enoyl-CoA hydratase/carnithine racemase
MKKLILPSALFILFGLTGCGTGTSESDVNALTARLNLLEAEVKTLANTLSQKPPLALRLIKEGLENSFDMTLQQVLDWEAAHQSITLQTPQHKEIVELFLAAKKK